VARKAKSSQRRITWSLNATGFAHYEFNSVPGNAIGTDGRESPPLCGWRPWLEPGFAWSRAEESPCAHLFLADGSGGRLVAADPVPMRSGPIRAE
jgi:hypothetical protein